MSCESDWQLEPTTSAVLLAHPGEFLLISLQKPLLGLKRSFIEKTEAEHEAWPSADTSNSSAAYYPFLTLYLGLTVTEIKSKSNPTKYSFVFATVWPG